MSDIGTFREDTLLVIAPKYSTFTKGQIDQLCEYFEEVIVLVKYNKITSLGDYLGLEELQRLGPATRLAEESPANVRVIETPILYLPFDVWYRYLGVQHYRRVQRCIRKYDIDFDLVHCHFTWTSGYVGARLKEEYGTPCVLTVHENREWLGQELQSENKRIYTAWRDADRIIRVNKRDRGRIEEFNDSVVHIPNGLSQERFPDMSREEARNKLGIDEDKTLLFTLGNLIPRKRLDVLIDAVAQLSVNESRIRVVIGGHGKLRDDLEARIERYDLSDTVELLGYVRETDLPAWMNACDFFVLASEAEGNPTVMFEALGCGAPYVGTNVGGVDEIITSEEYGITCEPGDPKALADCIEQALDSGWDRNRIREYGNRFTWENIASEIIETYADVVNERRK